MKAYAIHWPRNFANEFEIIAFNSKKDRDIYVDSDPGGDSAHTEQITRAEARRRLPPNWLSPGDVDHTGALNCYLGGKEGMEEDYRREDCQNEIIFAALHRELPTGACEEPVRL